MNLEQDHSPAPEAESSSSASERTQEKRSKIPWITVLLLAWCTLVIAGLTGSGEIDSWDDYSKVGYLEGFSVWNGSYWALITSALVHIDFLHFAANVYWLWVLGSVLERAIGHGRYLAFFVLSALMSSTFQLALSDDTGIGASGVVYAMFGFMWWSRKRVGEFDRVLDVRTIRIFMIWLFVCVLLTFLKVWQAGNAAHFSGLIFGALLALPFNAGSISALKRWLPATTMMTVSVVMWFWCPWSVSWLGTKAFREHSEGKYQSALITYSTLIERDPDNAWAYFNRGVIQHDLKDIAQAKQDMDRAHRIDPSYKTYEEYSAE